MSRKIPHVMTSRMMVKLIGLSSFKQILIKGKANAQKMIGRRMRNGKYFLVDILERFVDGNIIEGEQRKPIIYNHLAICILIWMDKTKKD
jgi:hypothetical protein